MKRRALAFFLCVLTSICAFWTGFVTIYHWDDLWSGGNYYDSNSIMTPMYNYYDQLQEVMDLSYTKQWEGALTYSEQERLTSLLAILDPAVTNFRYQVHDESGRLVLDNLSGQLVKQVSPRVRTDRFTLSRGQELARQDYWRTDPETGQELLMVYTGTGMVTVNPVDTSPNSFNEYGYHFYFEDSGDTYSNFVYSDTYDKRVQRVDLVAEFGVQTPVEPGLQDEFSSNQEDYNLIQRWLPSCAVMAGLLLVAALWLTARLCRRAGRDRATGALVLTCQDRVPLELYLTADFLLVALFLQAGDAATFSFNRYGNPASVVGVGLFSGLTATVALLLVQTVAVRLKNHSFWSNTLCSLFWHKLREAFSNWSMVSRAVILFVLYLLGTAATTFTVVLVPLFQGFVLWHICRYVKQWKAIQAGTQRMVEGEPEFVIDTRRMYPDLGAHAEQLGELGRGMARAVEERIKGERFKAELITNVSHDLKTPLTSIINYVDLLKKAGISDTAALEYLEVLDRKSQRLKKLTEDLVEASKASTGNLTVLRERLGFTQLLSQAMGEYEEKLTQAGLETVTAMPDHELYVEADGRHLWRVMDNLLGNCAKYAMPGTRVYIDVKAWDSQVCLSVKNISKSPLNIPAEQLMERFVRGDESRTAEGSGLGLSIARSLTELQGGGFRLDIDGDLFKAVVAFPEYKEPLPLSDGAAQTGGD